MTDSASLRLDRLARTFGKVRALDELSLEIPAGAFVTLLGPSGCGKSTTLNLIAGLDRPDGGTVYLGDRDITEVPPNERRMAMVFQNYALYPHMTAFDNIGFSLKLQRRPKDEIQTRVRLSPRCSTSRTCCSASRASCRAASSSASRSVGR